MDERSLFEAYMFSTGMAWDNSREDDSDGDEQYADVETRLNWGVWQAARAGLVEQHHRDSAELRRLCAERDACREKALEEAAKVCDDMAENWNLQAQVARDGRYDFMAEAADRCADQVRALSASTGEESGHER